MITSLRWITFLPLALMASVFIGAAASWFSGILRGSDWYVWLISGVASGWAFFFVALHVAPIVSNFVKWTSVFIVAVLGLTAALGPLMSGRERISSLAGVAMLGMAIYYARLPVAAIKADVKSTVSS